MALVISLSYPRITGTKTNSLFLNPRIAEIHTDFLRAVLFSGICEDLRKSVDNPSGRDGFCCLISLRQSRFRLQRFRFAIPRRRIGDQRFKKMMRGMGHVIHCAIERCLIYPGRFGETAQLPDELKRRCANFILSSGWTEVMKCFDGSAHVGTINTSRSTINYFVFR
jgi:hypothetical protein